MRAIGGYSDANEGREGRHAERSRSISRAVTNSIVGYADLRFCGFDYFHTRDASAALSMTFYDCGSK
ncbi:hypothetical protein GCM10022407_18350 [Hymenobacter antarcticus]|uniref:Uncharacterized protein n=1 Tax=Hymenobacter antarcticus TaxID=486270 RepID=A0ABP7PX17_9BACT